MCRGHDGQDARRAGDRGFHSWSPSLKLLVQVAAPDLGFGIRIVEKAAPQPVGVPVLLPIPARIQRRIGIGAAAACQAGAPAAFERERLEVFRSLAAAETEGTGVRSGGDRIAGQQKPVRARPHAIHHAVRPVLAQKVGVTITREAPRSGAQRRELLRVRVLARHFQLTNGRLMVGHPQVLGPILGRQPHRHARSQRVADHSIVKPFGVQVELDLTTRLRRTCEHCFPERIAALAHPTLAVGPQRHAGDRRACLQQCAERIAAIGRMVVGCQALDDVVGARAICPSIAVSPDSQLEVDAVRNCLAADESQHLQVSVTLGIRQIHGPHGVAGHGKQERVGK